jgi:hypothetical protein
LNCRNSPALRLVNGEANKKVLMPNFMLCFGVGDSGEPRQFASFFRAHKHFQRSPVETKPLGCRLGDKFFFRCRRASVSIQARMHTDGCKSTPLAGRALVCAPPLACRRAGICQKAGIKMACPHGNILICVHPRPSAVEFCRPGIRPC